MIAIIQTLLLLAGIIFVGVIACILGWIHDELEKPHKAIDQEYETCKRLPLPDDDGPYDQFEEGVRGDNVNQ